MDNFTCYNPTKLYFGKAEISKLHDELKNYQNVLLVYGGGSIKKMGLYNQVIEILKSENKFYLELYGVEPNPKLKKVREGIRIVKENILIYF